MATSFLISPPYFGGMWEVRVKSIKINLKREVGDSTLTYEELCTVLCQIEACLNSRPLCELNSDPTSLLAITPGHFLTGNAITAPPDATKMDEKVTHINRWKRLQKKACDFWTAWQRE